MALFRENCDLISDIIRETQRCLNRDHHHVTANTHGDTFSATQNFFTNIIKHSFSKVGLLLHTQQRCLTIHNSPTKCLNIATKRA